jgi:NAD(P) transhydrogenase subunit alpha
MSTGLLADISIFVLAILVGFEVISKVPSTLHTPLMSASNAIHGIVLVGVMVTAAAAHDTVGYVLSFVAAVFAAMNVVGGYAVTDRMLEMFRKRPAPPAPGDHAVSTDHTGNGS